MTIRSESFFVSIDDERCHGCGNCALAAPDTFVVKDSVAHVRLGKAAIEPGAEMPVAPLQEVLVQFAADECPFGAIAVDSYLTSTEV